MLHEQFTEKLGEQLRQNFEDICEDRGVVGSLNGLDGMVEEARRRRKMAGETGEREGGVGGRSPVPYVRFRDMCLAGAIG